MEVATKVSDRYLMEDSQRYSHLTTYMTLASGFKASAASWTVLYTGNPKCSDPPFLGVTPPTILVPYEMACWEWNVPCFPVKPWQITRVFLSIQTLAVLDISRWDTDEARITDNPCWIIIVCDTRKMSWRSKTRRTQTWRWGDSKIANCYPWIIWHRKWNNMENRSLSGIFHLHS